jgi:hypothetical protein
MDARFSLLLDIASDDVGFEELAWYCSKKQGGKVAFKETLQKDLLMSFSGLCP